MEVLIREFTRNDIPAMLTIWNEVVDDGIAFPQTERLTEENGMEFFSAQSFTGVAENPANSEILGLYILHPNNIGRCGHISNASYAVKSSARGFRVGGSLVKHSLEKGKELGFKIIQFNAVVRTNVNAVHLYQKLGFIKLGIIPQGFLMKNGLYEDIILFYRTL